MNSCNMNFEKGDEIILKEGKKAVFVEGGFGCRTFTNGSAMFVRPANGGDAFRIDATEDIDVEATKALHQGGAR